MYVGPLETYLDQPEVIDDTADSAVPFSRHLELVPDGNSSVLIDSGADPWVRNEANDFYYCCTSPETNRLLVARSDTLKGIGHAALQEIWQPRADQSECALEVWAPELHRFGDSWYIYFAGSDGNNENHRMFVLKSQTEDAQGKYDFMGRVDTGSDYWAIDGTVLTMPDESQYFIWSGWADKMPGSQHLYIASMANPCELSSERVLISSPTYEWECRGWPINEGPEVLQRQGQINIIYSASACWTNEYCLGRLVLRGDDPMEPSAWEKQPEPVFCQTGNVFGPGHASFVQSEGKDWIVYHAARSDGSGWDRQVRAKPFEWHPDGTPDFGHPI